jgi:hypothetical protein
MPEANFALFAVVKLVYSLFIHGSAGRIGKGQVPKEHFIQDDTQRPNIC